MKAKRFIKRSTAVLLSLMMIVTLFSYSIVDSIAATVNQDSTGAGTAKVHIVNSGSYSYLYVWDSSDTALSSSWPGNTISNLPREGNYPTFTTSYSTATYGIILNNGSLKTDDLTGNTGEIWVDCSTGTPVITSTDPNAIAETELKSTVTVTPASYVKGDETVSSVTVEVKKIDTDLVTEFGVLPVLQYDLYVTDNKGNRTILTEAASPDVNKSGTGYKKFSQAYTELAELNAGEYTVTCEISCTNNDDLNKVIKTSKNTGALTVTDPNALPIPKIAKDKTSGLYVHSVLDYAGDDKATPVLSTATDLDSWSKIVPGTSTTATRLHAYLPSSADSQYMTVYNAGATDATINDQTVPAGSYANIDYITGYISSGTGYHTVNIADSDYTGFSSLRVYRSDSDGGLYLNSSSTTTGTMGSFSGSNASLPDMYEYLASSKENALSTDYGFSNPDNSISSTSTTGETVSKIKGRGNTSWSADKKGFNVKFSKDVTLNGVKGRNFSLVANMTDASLLRNRIVYDLANAVNSKYATKTSNIEFYIDGEYMGSYIITQKISIGDAVDINTSNDVVSGDNVNFSFVVEVDANDQVAPNEYFVSNALYRAYGGSYLNGGAASGGVESKTVDIQGNTIVGGSYDCVTLKDAGESGDDWASANQESRQFISDKWEQLVEILYNINPDGSTHNYTLADLEEVCNVNSLVNTYLVNELAKNLDIGVTSTYFTYDANKGIWYVAPVWDFDRGFGSVSGTNNARQSIYTKANLNLNSVQDFTVADLVYYGNSAYGNSSYKSLNIIAQGLTKNGGLSEIIDAWNNRYQPALEYLAQTDNTSSDSYVRTNVDDGTTSGTRLHYGGYYKSMMTNSWEMNKVACTRFYKTQLTGDAYYVSINNTSKDATVTTGSASSATFDQIFTGMTDWIKARTAWLDNAYDTYSINGVPELGLTWSTDTIMSETSEGSGVYQGAFTTTATYDESAAEHQFDIANLSSSKREEMIYAAGEQYLTLDCSTGLNLKEAEGGCGVDKHRTTNTNLTFTGKASTMYYYVYVPKTGFVGVYKTLAEANSAINGSIYYVSGTWQANNGDLSRGTPEIGHMTYSQFTGKYTVTQTITKGGTYNFKLTAQDVSDGVKTQLSTNNGAGGTYFLLDEAQTVNSTLGTSTSGESKSQSDYLYINAEEGDTVTFTYDPVSTTLTTDVKSSYPLYFTAANLTGTLGFSGDSYNWVSMLDADRTRFVRAYLYSDESCTNHVKDSDNKNEYVDMKWDTDDANCYGKYVFVGQFTLSQTQCYMGFTLCEANGTAVSSVDSISVASMQAGVDKLPAHEGYILTTDRLNSAAYLEWASYNYSANTVSWYDLAKDAGYLSQDDNSSSAFTTQQDAIDAFLEYDMTPDGVQHEKGYLNGQSDYIFFDNSSTQWYEVWMWCWGDMRGNGTESEKVQMTNIKGTDIWFYKFGKENLQSWYNSNDATNEKGFLFVDRDGLAWGYDYSQSIDLNNGNFWVDYHDETETAYEKSVRTSSDFKTQYANANLPAFISHGFYDSTTNQTGIDKTDVSSLVSSDFKYRAFNDILYDLAVVTGHDDDVQAKATTFYFDLHSNTLDTIYLYMSSTTNSYSVPRSLTLTRMGTSTIYSATDILPYVKDENGDYQPAYTLDNLKSGAAGAKYAVPSSAQPNANAFKTGEVWFECTDLFLSAEGIATPQVNDIAATALANPFEQEVSTTSTAKKQLLATAANVDIISSSLSCSGGYVYFDASGWSTTGSVQLCIGHSSYTSAYAMTKVANTDLYYYSMPQWDGATYIAFIGNSSAWGSGSWGQSNLANAACYTGTYNSSLASGSTYLYLKASASKGATLSRTYGTSRTDILNFAQSATAMVSTNGGSSYAIDSSAVAGTTKVSGYYSSSNGASASASVNSSSGTAKNSVMYSSTVTMTTSNVNSALYDFVGWSSNGTSADLGTSSTYTYKVSNSAKTVYALYKMKQYTVSSTVSDHGTLSGCPDGLVNAGTTYTLTATPSTGYEVGTFTVNGSTVSSPYSLTVNSNTDVNVEFTPIALGTPSISGNNAITTAESTELTASCTGGSQSYSYAWSIDGGDTYLPGETSDSYTFESAVAGTYDVVVKVTDTVTGLVATSANYSVIVESAGTCVGPIFNTISPKTLNMGQTYTNLATVNEYCTDGTIVYSSTEGSVASVTQDGVVTAHTPGTTNITATCADGSSSYKVTVNSPTLSEFGTASREMLLGDTFNQQVTVTNPATSGGAITYSSSVPLLASVDSNSGTVTAVSPTDVNPVTITATYKVDGTTYDTKTYTVNVLYPELADFATQEAEVVIGGTYTQTTTAINGAVSGGSILYESSNPDVVSVDSSTGEITGILPTNGMPVIITATYMYNDTCYGTTEYEVTVPTPSISIEETLVASIGGNTIPVVTLSNCDSATAISYESDDDTIATVSPDGAVTGISNGTANITASITVAGATYSDTCAVTVNPATVAVTGSHTTSTETSVTYNTVLTGIDNGTVTWSIRNSSGEEIGTSNTISYTEAGTYTVTATVTYGTYSVSSSAFTVTVNEKYFEYIEFASSVTLNSKVFAWVWTTGSAGKVRGLEYVGTTAKNTKIYRLEVTSNSTNMIPLTYSSYTEGSTTWPSGTKLTSGDVNGLSNSASVNSYFYVDSSSAGGSFAQVVSTTPSFTTNFDNIVANDSVTLGITNSDSFYTHGATVKYYVDDEVVTSPWTATAGDHTIKAVFNNNVNYTKTITQDFSVTAKYNVTVEDCTNGTITGIASGSVTAGSEYDVYLTPNEGYEVSSFLVNGEEVTSYNPYHAVINQDTTISATFTAIPLTTPTITGTNAIDTRHSSTLTASCTGGSNTYTYQWSEDNGETWTDGDTTHSVSSATPTTINVMVKVTDTITGEVITSETFPVEVSVPNGPIFNSVADKTLYINETYSNPATVQGDASAVVNYSSSDDAIATVDENGLVTAHSNGEVIIEAALGYGENDYYNVIVLKPDLTAFVTDSVSLNVTDTYVQTVTASNEAVSGGSLTYSSSDDTKVSVDANSGTVTAVAPTGDTPVTITATYAVGEKTFATSTYTVEVTTPSVSFESNTLTAVIGTPIACPATNVTNVTDPVTPVITVDETDVITVNEDGTLTALKDGTAVITATITVDGVEYTDTCTVTVNPATVNVSGSSTTTQNSTVVFTASTTNIDAAKTITWSIKNSDGDEIATTNSYTFEEVGTYTVTATATLGDYSVTSEDFEVVVSEAFYQYVEVAPSVTLRTYIYGFTWVTGQSSFLVNLEDLGTTSTGTRLFRYKPTVDNSNLIFITTSTAATVGGGWPSTGTIYRSRDMVGATNCTTQNYYHYVSAVYSSTQTVTESFESIRSDEPTFATSFTDLVAENSIALSVTNTDTFFAHGGTVTYYVDDAEVTSPWTATAGAHTVKAVMSNGVNYSKTITQDITVADNIDVTFNYQDDVTSATTVARVENSTFADYKPENPAREGYEFLGWYDDPTEGSIVADDTVITEDTNVYAHWSINSYYIDLPEGDGFIITECPSYAEYNELVTISIVLEDHFELTGWTTTPAGIVSGTETTVTFNMPASDVEITPNVSAIQYNISLTGNALRGDKTYPYGSGDCGVSVNGGTVSYSHGTATATGSYDSTVTYTASVQSYSGFYEFVGFYSDADCLNQVVSVNDCTQDTSGTTNTYTYETTLTGNSTMYALFIKAIFIATEDGTTTMMDYTRTEQNNVIYSAPCPVNSIGSSTSNFFFISDRNNADSNTYLNKGKVNATLNEGVTLTSSTVNGSDRIYISSEPSTGYDYPITIYYDGSQYSSTGTPVYGVASSADAYTVTPVASAYATTLVDGSADPVRKNTTKTFAISATPSDGYTVTGYTFYSDDTCETVADPSTYSFDTETGVLSTVTCDLYVKTTTSKIDYTASATVYTNTTDTSSTTGGTVDITNSTFNIGDEVSFTATAQSGYQFVGFYSDATCESLLTSESTYNVTDAAASNITVYALFKQVYSVSVTDDGTGTISVSNTAPLYGDTVTVTVNAPEGYYISSIDGITGGTYSAGNLTFTKEMEITENVTATATYTSRPTVSVIANNSAIGSITGAYLGTDATGTLINAGDVSGYVANINDSIFITTDTVVNANGVHQFKLDHWNVTVNGETTSVSASTSTFEITGDTTIEAVFTECTFYLYESTTATSVPLVSNNDGTYSYLYVATTTGTLQFKVNNGADEWYGTYGSSSNFNYDVVAGSTYNVTFTLANAIPSSDNGFGLTIELESARVLTGYAVDQNGNEFKGISIGNTVVSTLTSAGTILNDYQASLSVSSQFAQYFSGWYDTDNQLLSNELTYTTTLSADTTVYAKFDTKYFSILSYKGAEVITDGQDGIINATPSVSTSNGATSFDWDTGYTVAMENSYHTLYAVPGYGLDSDSTIGNMVASLVASTSASVEGYTFLGWFMGDDYIDMNENGELNQNLLYTYTADNCLAIDENGYITDDSTTLTAVWTPTLYKYVITYNYTVYNPTDKNDIPHGHPLGDGDNDTENTYSVTRTIYATQAMFTKYQDKYIAENAPICKDNYYEYSFSLKDMTFVEDSSYAEGGYYAVTAEASTKSAEESKVNGYYVLMGTGSDSFTAVGNGNNVLGADASTVPYQYNVTLTADNPTDYTVWYRLVTAPDGSQSYVVSKTGSSYTFRITEQATTFYCKAFETAADANTYFGTKLFDAGEGTDTIASINSPQYSYAANGSTITTTADMVYEYTLGTGDKLLQAGYIMYRGQNATVNTDTGSKSQVNNNTSYYLDRISGLTGDTDAAKMQDLYAQFADYIERNYASFVEGTQVNDNNTFASFMSTTSYLNREDKSRITYTLTVNGTTYQRTYDFISYAVVQHSDNTISVVLSDSMQVTISRDVYLTYLSTLSN